VRPVPRRRGAHERRGRVVKPPTDAVRLYVASSWRNRHYFDTLARLRAEGFDCYDFRNPDPSEPSNKGFSWAEIDPNWQQWTPAEFRAALRHPIARKGFALDDAALRGCDACVLVMPCGRSAHLEAGFAMGQGKPVVVYIPEPCEPELMYGLAGEHCIALDLDEIAPRLRAMLARAGLTMPANVAKLHELITGSGAWSVAFMISTGAAGADCETEETARAYYLDALHGTGAFARCRVPAALLASPDSRPRAWFEFDAAHHLTQYPEPVMQPAAEPFADLDEEPRT
jgi:hypothetical protein